MTTQNNATREIKSRARKIEDGKWGYGWFINYSETKGFICSGYTDNYKLLEVNPKTVGQYTGVKDKNGVEIYEGDRVRVSLKYFHIENMIAKVLFKQGSFGVHYGCNDDYFKPLSAWDEVEIVGTEEQ